MEKLLEPKDEVLGKIKGFYRSSFHEKVASKKAAEGGLFGRTLTSF